jgi:capsular exopolysaccharide synthesis family protein
MENLQKQIESLRRWRWLVIAFGLLGMVAALAIASSGDTTYTATSVVVVGSASTQSTSSRSPDQDAVLAQGYVSILNSDSQQRTLKALGKIPDDVAIAASPVAGSPFIDIAATAATPEAAIQASTAFATGFVNNTLKQFTDIVGGTLEPLRTRLREVSTQIAADEQQLADPSSLSTSQIAQLQGELDQLKAEASGLSEAVRVQSSVAGNPNLAGLYAKPDGTTTSSPRVVTNGVLGLIGGLLLGGAVALMLGALELRIRSAADVRRRLELPTLGSVSSGRGRIQDARRAEDFKILASALAVMKPPVTSIAVVSPNEGEGKTLVAENLARYRAAQGGRVILVEADMRSQDADARSNGRRPEGLSDLLRTAGRVDIRSYIHETDFPGLWVIPAGTRTEDPYTLLSSDRIKEVIAQATAEADLVVIDTPGLLAAAESQIISAGTDGSVLVLDATTTAPSAALEARDLLRRGGANILGVVLNRVSKSSAVYS